MMEKSMKRKIGRTLLCVTGLFFGITTFNVMAATQSTPQVVAAAAAVKEEAVKAVYHINDTTVARGALYNIANHLSVDPTAKIVVVVHGKGIDFLLEGSRDVNGNPYDAQIDELQRKGVVFEACRKTLQGRHLSEKDLISDIKIVPSGVAELARLQAKEGFIYIKP